MDTTHLTDPVELVRTLDPDSIRSRLEIMEHERSALLVLLRAALRARRPDPARATRRKEVQRAG